MAQQDDPYGLMASLSPQPTTAPLVGSYVPPLIASAGAGLSAMAQQQIDLQAKLAKEAEQREKERESALREQGKQLYDIGLATFQPEMMASGTALKVGAGLQGASTFDRTRFEPAAQLQIARERAKGLSDLSGTLKLLDEDSRQKFISQYGPAFGLPEGLQFAAPTENIETTRQNVQTAISNMITGIENRIQNGASKDVTADETALNTLRQLRGQTFVAPDLATVLGLGAQAQGVESGGIQRRQGVQRDPSARKTSMLSALQTRRKELENLIGQGTAKEQEPIAEAIKQIGDAILKVSDFNTTAEQAQSIMGAALAAPTGPLGLRTQASKPEGVVVRTSGDRMFTVENVYNPDTKRMEEKVTDIVNLDPTVQQQVRIDATKAAQERAARALQLSFSRFDYAKARDIVDDAYRKQRDGKLDARAQVYLGLAQKAMSLREKGDLRADRQFALDLAQYFYPQLDPISATKSAYEAANTILSEQYADYLNSSSEARRQEGRRLIAENHGKIVASLLEQNARRLEGLGADQPDLLNRLLQDLKDAAAGKPLRSDATAPAAPPAAPATAPPGSAPAVAPGGLLPGLPAGATGNMVPAPPPQPNMGLAGARGPTSPPAGSPREAGNKRINPTSRGQQRVGTKFRAPGSAPTTGN